MLSSFAYKVYTTIIMIMVSMMWMYFFVNSMHKVTDMENSKENVAVMQDLQTLGEKSKVTIDKNKEAEALVSNYAWNLFEQVMWK